MRFRRHHNNTGYRRIKNGSTSKTLERMARRIFRNKVRKIGTDLIVKEANHDNVLVENRHRTGDNRSV